MLNLNRTQVNDTTIKTVAGCRRLSELRLGHTQITDRGLLELTGLPIIQLGVAGTRVTVDGLIAANVPYDGFLHVGEEQFTRAEQVALMRALMSRIQVTPLGD